MLEESTGKYTRRLIVTESVFSMDGDRSDIDGLVALALQYDAILMVDEALATGVLGDQGMGLTAGKAYDFSFGFAQFCDGGRVQVMAHIIGE